jgi:Tfp pilus assembly protein PilF
VETLRTALDLALQDPSVSTRSVIIGRGLGLLNEWQLARVAFESAVELDEKNAEAWAWLAEAKQQTDMAHGGEYTELEKALELNPDSPTVRGLRGLYFQRTGNFRQALTEFQAAAALEPKNPTWLVSVGEAYAKNGDLIRALESYRSATTLAPQDPAYWRLLAIFCAQNQVNIQDIGVPAARQAVILAEDDANSLDVLGWLLILDVSYDAAERMLERALALDAQNASVHLHLGMLNLQTNHRASAYDHLIHARDLGNSDAEAILKQYFP